MADLNVRSDSIDVDDIMRQIRARIRDKRGADYTEEEVRHLATVKLERLLDPESVRSNLLEHYRRARAAEPPVETFEFEAHSIYESHRAPLRFIRRLLSPIVKLFFNANRISHALHLQTKINEHLLRRRELDALTFEVLNNLVVELTRTTLEAKHLRLRLESMSARLDFAERRARALEGVVQYRPDALAGPPRDEDDEGATEGESAQADAARKRRRRRRGRRRPGADEGTSAAAGSQESPPAQAPDPGEAAPPPNEGGAGSDEQ
ncbi:MAG: hypothetical protein KJ061_03170 [Vicinamibacteraceae bacterium]|nr:hypothetical protein [Vicinamibacteraceae bacterium]